MNYVKLFAEYNEVVTLQSATYQTLANGRQTPTWTTVATDEAPLAPASMNRMQYEAGMGITMTAVLYLDITDNAAIAAVVAIGNRIVAGTKNYDVVGIHPYGTHLEVSLNVVL